MFDLGIYERPNMLSLHGIERGTFGMRAFLERPVADGLVDEKHEHSSSDPEPTNTTCEAGKNSASLTEHLSTSEALKALAHDEGSVHVGKHAPPIDRVALLRDGPKAWKRVGVRDMSLRTVTERLELISKLRDDVVKRGWRYTVLQVWTEEEMGDWLFGELLYPPEKRAGRGGGGGVEAGSKGHELKVQIEALVKVLTTRGAWLDFSLPRERLLFSQNLYAKEAASDGSGVDAMGLRPEIKRRWGLIQLLLSVELVLRLDAALRLGVASHSEKVEVSSVEIHHFNRLRNLKVDWDFVVARRWLDLCYVRKVPKNEVGGAPPAVETPADASPPPKSHHGQKEGGFFGRFKETLHIRDKEKEEDSWPYDCAVLPRQPSVMADGLLRFAEDIGWDADAVEHIRRQLAEKLCDKTLEQREEMLARGTEALDHPHVAQHHKDKSKVELKAAGEHTLGGPLTHTWLGGLIIPGYFACDLLMCALLESDTKQMAVEKLGNMAHPRSGFVLNSRSWWSKLCVVGVVLADADNAVERMGWIGLPTPLSPHDHETGQALGDGWWLIVSKDVPRLRNGERILDGDDMAKESSTLGVGKGHIMASEFGMLTDHAFNGMERMEVTNLRLILKWLPQPQQQQPGDRDQPYEAAVSASVAREGAGEHARKHKLLPLRYSVRFVGGHPCRPPHGHAKQAKQASPQDSGDKLQPLAAPKHLEHLPAHPLHKSYKYSLRSIEEVIDLGPGDELTLPNPTDKEASPVWVIDARGGWQRETLVRAWCASVGRHAIVSRVGVGCIACAVREARALEIGVIIRVEA
ncbi:uncharacterized protein HMPREF1541_05018 [Cyphellophora europaea CBS 101466]|uniref:Uncharacterized protein n=1 Tax=Cyphellophora europaea (strain CBS 101466) TaxID=1220924 RepID=W2RY68_CYPE1|nr:uncharacterized protein HMPREF1541_05018 [Cyphellophora europaea CBS 101466]ETN40738.1 hypothetical protein HMPREF1541_05018 [Cyphellophora europaea CBS 101466]